MSVYSEKYGGFAFDERIDLASIEEEAYSFSSLVAGASAGTKQRGTTVTAHLAKEAKKGMKEMEDILGRLSTGTATREEKSRLKSLNSKLSRLRKDVEKSATRDCDHELESLRKENHEKTRILLKSIKEQQIKGVIRDVCAAERVDLAFVIDCTGSMAPYIESVKANIKHIVRQVARTNGNLQIRLAVVAYRDISDVDRYEVFDFVTCIESFEESVGKLRAFGGNDAPEDMAGGIQKANGLSWNNPTRIAFLIADAPCHGSEFHRLADSYPGGTPGISIVNELRDLLKCHDTNGTMSIHFGSITSHTDAMIERFRTGYGIDLSVRSVKDTTKLKDTVTSSVRRSIFKTMTVTGSHGKVVSFTPPSNINSLIATVKGGGASGMAQLKLFSLVSRIPSTNEWRRCTPLKVGVYINKKIQSLKELQRPIGFGMVQIKKLLRRGSVSKATSKTEHNTMYMRRANNPFAQGEIRIAFYSQLACAVDELDLNKNSMVLKSFKHVGKGIHDKEQYIKQMEVSNIAHFLATQYNTTKKPSHCASVRFLPVCVVEETSSTREHLGERRFCAEPPLPSGNFAKFSSNTGYWAEDLLDETLLCFTRWTHDVTEGYLMVTDLQGVKHGNNYYLTDPVILCKDVIRFGNTNLGEKFMKKCIDATLSHLKENGWA